MNEKNEKSFRYCYDGSVRMKSDPLDSSDQNAVLDWFDEEQGVLMEVAERYLPNALERSSGDICLDPGCGSAILSIIAAKRFELTFKEKIKRVVAIDPNEGAIAYARINTELNGLQELYDFRVGSYASDSVPRHSAAIISHNVPYHPTSERYAGRPFVSCDGGVDGQKWLRPFLEYSSQHLAENGVLYGIINCRGGKEPEFMGYVRNCYVDDSIYWYPIHKPCSTYGLLEYITRWKESDWARGVAETYPLNHVGIYVIVRDHERKTEFVEHNFHYRTENWQFRWDAHRLIQDGAFRGLN